MKTYSQNVKIRILIMLIAFLGGMSFLSYVVFNSSVANNNEKRIDELQNVKTPVLEMLSLLKRDIERTQQAFTTAIVFENAFLLDEAKESSDSYSRSIYAITSLDKSIQPIANKLQRDFTDYFQASNRMTIQLIEFPDQSRLHEKKIYHLNQMRSLLVNEIDLIIDNRKQDFISSLAKTHSEIVSANNIGALLGGLLILGLIILSWAVSVTVIKAVNRSNQLKEVFMNTMSHELRTPINGISGALSLLETTQLTEEQVELIDACKISEQSIITSVDDILEFSGMVSGTIKIAQHPLSFYNVIRNTIELFSADMESKGITLSIDYDKSFDPQTMILGDEQRLSHGLRHIMGNAVKFSNSGTIKVSISCQTYNKDPERSMITVCVIDEGPGIPQDKLKTVYEPFQQIDGSFSRQHQGIGIGIPMVNSIAKAMDGALDIRNRKGKYRGLEVEFKFMAKVTSTPILEPIVKHSLAIQNRDISVLVVEDNEVNQLVLKSFIRKMGYRYQSAFNGQEAVERIANQPFTIILMDCQMPVMNGFDATEAIRRLPNGKNIPIIAVTANAMVGDRERCLDAGMNDYLKKPVSMGQLRAAMNKFLFNPDN
ncbi:MAG: signal transduction histidine kinase/CheY-like chemotaxis protein [Bermanella sp.]|jgi:signal transduction histidine kinase/CheY-like chemotaxis protein